MRHLIHKAICWYLRRCGSAFHCYNYGPAGCYVVMMSDEQFGIYQKSERVIREILISHGTWGDGSNLDKLTRSRCLELLKASDRHSNDGTQRRRDENAPTATDGQSRPSLE